MVAPMRDRTPSQRGRASRSKGKRGELEVVALLIEHGFPARRGLSQPRGGGREEPDVVCDALCRYHLEVKRGARPNLTAAVRQAEADCANGQVPVAVTRADGAEWLATLPLAELLRVLRIASTHEGTL
jgi:hypothetical protein